MDVPAQASLSPKEIHRRQVLSALVVRLEAQVEGLRRMRGRLVYILVVGLALAVVLLFVKLLAALLMVVAAVSIFGVGHYIAFVHLAEDTAQVDEARAELESLEADVSRGD